MPWIKTANDGVLMHIHLTPRASRDQVDGFHGGAVKVKIKAPPVDGKANAYLLAFLANTLGVSKSAVLLVRGETSREKTVMVRGMTESEIKEKLELE